MKFKLHLLSAIILTPLVFWIFDLPILFGLAFFFSLWLIDVDHYPAYVFLTKKWNPLDAIKGYVRARKLMGSLSLKERRKYKKLILIFHNWMLLVILLVLGILIHPIFFWVLLGVAIHLSLDILELIQKRQPIWDKLFPFLYTLPQNRNRESQIKFWE